MSVKNPALEVRNLVDTLYDTRTKWRNTPELEIACATLRSAIRELEGVGVVLMDTPNAKWGD